MNDSKRPQKERRRLEPWVGPWLRALREERRDRLSREEIARRLERDVSSVTRLELGDSAVPADDLPIVLKAYEVTPSQFARRVAKEAA